MYVCFTAPRTAARPAPHAPVPAAPDPRGPLLPHPALHQAAAGETARGRSASQYYKHSFSLLSLDVSILYYLLFDKVINIEVGYLRAIESKSPVRERKDGDRPSDKKKPAPSTSNDKGKAKHSRLVLSIFYLSYQWIMI